MKLEYLEKDEIWGNAPHRPDLVAELAQGKRGKLLVTIYRTGGEGPHPVVLLSHGFPGVEKNFDLAQALRRIGFHVVAYHYSGSWNSDGYYAFSHDIEDGESVLDFILQNDMLGFDKNRIFAAGQSVGGFVTTHLFAKRKELRAAAVLAPCDLGEAAKMGTETEAGKLLLDILADGAPWLNGTSAEILLKETQEHTEDFRICNLAEKMADRPLLCIGAGLDECCPPPAHCLPWVNAVQAAGGTIRYEEMQTDHSFSDMRLEMIRRTAVFLADECEKATPAVK